MICVAIAAFHFSNLFLRMAKRYYGTNLFLFFLLLVCTSCTGQTGAGASGDSAQKKQPVNDTGLGLPKSAEEMKLFLDAGIDPYFIETNDTISVYGPQCIVRNLLQDKKGNYWLATWHGIIKYDGSVFTNYTLKEGLIHFHVTTLFEDSKGNLWFGNARGGVYCYDGKSFTRFTTKDGLADNTANCIAEDQTGNIWFGTEHGASRFDGKTFTGFTTREGLADNFINMILCDKSGTIWFATNNGISTYDGKSFAAFTGKDDEPFKQVASLFEDRNGNIWIGSGAKDAGGNGLCFYDGKTVKIMLTPYYVMYMCEDKSGNLWLAHNKGAAQVNFTLYRYDGKSFTAIRTQTEKDNPLIFGILNDNKGFTWFGTTKGVCRYDGKTFHYFRRQ